MKYIIKNCLALWKHSETKMFRCENGKKCTENTDCVIKQIVELCKVNNCLCDNCDGVGYFDGCKDSDCSFYRLMQIETLLEIEEVNE